jgi:prolyl-tRNA synthetase
LKLEPLNLPEGTTLPKARHRENGIADRIADLLDEIQASLYEKALRHRQEHTTEVSSYAEFKEVLDGKGGFIVAHWDGTSETEQKIKEETKATIRLIPLESKFQVTGKCVHSGKDSNQIVVFAQSILTPKSKARYLIPLSSI